MQGVPGSANLMGGATPPQITFVGQYSGDPGTVNIGAARADRIVVAISSHESDGAISDTITIGGVTGGDGYIYNAASADPLTMAYKVVPTGTTVNITTGGTYSFVYVITGVTQFVSTPGAVASGSTDTVLPTGTLPATPSAIIGVARSRAATSGWAASISGNLRNATLDASAGSGGSNHSPGVASCYADGGGSGTLTISNAGYSSGFGLLAIFK